MMEKDLGNPMSPRGPDIMAELDGLTEEQLITEKIRNLQALEEVKEVIAAAELRVITHREYPDADWWRRVNSARRIHGLRDQAIVIRIQQIQKQKKEEFARLHPTSPKKPKELPGFFMDVARVMLPNDSFEAILARARELMQAAEDRAVEKGRGDERGSAG